MSTPGNVHVTNTEIKVIDLLFPILAVVFTVLRLILRVRSSRFWWDDTLACGSAIFSMLMSATTWVHYMDPAGLSKTTRIVAYYGIAEMFYLALWTARLSILYSILRIVPEPGTRRLLNVASVAFAFVCAFLCAQVFWVCENQPGWKEKPQPQCALGLQVAVCQLLTDVASDALLIAVPIKLFARTKLGRGLKIRLLVIFSAAALTTIVSLVHAAYILEGRGVQAIVSAIVEISVSLIVCNFVVVIPAFWRLCGVRDDTDHGYERTFKLSSVRFARPAANISHLSGADAESRIPSHIPRTGYGTEESTTSAGLNLSGGKVFTLEGGEHAIQLELSGKGGFSGDSSQDEGKIQSFDRH